jgi:hypothetical protein
MPANNASKWQMGFNLAFKGLKTVQPGYNDIGLCVIWSIA